ncbi:MAG: glycosyltransferase [Gammaproteobacteria bacterium]
MRQLGKILHELELSGSGYALIHNEDDLCESIRSDIDIAFDRNPNIVMEPILRAMIDAGEIQVVQRLHYEVPFGYYYVLQVSGSHSEFLHLDCLYDPIGVNRYHLSTNFLLENNLKGQYSRKVAPEKEAVYLLIKRAIKGDISEDKFLQIIKLCNNAMPELWANIEEWFGSKEKNTIQAVLQAGDYTQAQLLINNLGSKLEDNYRKTHIWRYMFSVILSGFRKIKRFIQPTGLFVVILGPDGCGKSTVTNTVLSGLERAFRKTWRFHWRPNLLPKLSRKKLNDNIAENNDIPAESSKYTGILSLVRFLYYLLDFILGYWLVIYPRKAQTTLVIGERYFPDVLVHPARYGFSVPQWLMRLASKLVPSPDLIILLKGDPAAIYSRKPELPIDVIATQNDMYEKEINNWGKSVVVNVDKGAESVCENVSNQILNVSSSRTMQRLDKYNKSENWYCFPDKHNAKILVSNRDNLRNALNLYHPYSRVGCVAKIIFRSLPNWISQGVLSHITDRGDIQRLREITKTIHQMLGNNDLVVSFSTGTPGVHRKQTAQVSHDGVVKAYVKIGSNKEVISLLKHEECVLRSLDEESFSGALVPKVLGAAFCGGDFLLFLSAPDSPGEQRNGGLGKDDASFLTLLNDKARSAISVDKYISDLNIDVIFKDDETSTESNRKLIYRAIKFIHSAFNGDGVKCVMSHGDYAPWNTLSVENGALYVFDWEYAGNNAYLYDAFHYVFMPAKLVDKTSPQSAISQLSNLRSNPQFKYQISRHCENEDKFNAYLLIYLLKQVVKEFTENSKIDAYLQECLSYALLQANEPERRRKVLVAAYACEPNSGSEPGVGWNMCQSISQENEAWIITRKNNKEVIEKEMSLHPNPYLHFNYVDLPLWLRFWKKGARGIRTYYYLWQFAALFKAYKLKRLVNFDLAHHVTFVNDWMFTFLALLPIPYIWGPIGSHPKAIKSLVDKPIDLVKDRARYYFQSIMRSADPLYWASVLRASKIIGINKEVGRTFPISLLGKRKFKHHTAIGVESIFNENDTNDISHEGIRVLCMGRLVPIKAFHLSLRAFTNLVENNVKATLVIVGSGAERQKLLKLADDLKINNYVEFIDWLPREQALLEMRKADIFLFPSFEGGGMVVLEAMANGLPVVCLDYGGPGEMVAQNCGFKIKIGDLGDTVNELGDALFKLSQNQELRYHMSKIAMNHVCESYLWDRRFENISEWYSLGLKHNKKCRE